MPRLRRFLPARSALLATLLLALPLAAHAVCGDGVRDGAEECDSGDPAGAPDCNRFCRRTVFEPDGLPFAPRPGAAATGALVTEPTPSDPSSIYSPRLQCASPEVRAGARLGPAAVVRYRIHLCRDGKGVDAFPESEVRAAMKATAAALAGAGIVLEEESLVRFRDKDCDVSMDSPGWEDDLVAATPDGVVPVAFVANIFAVGVQFPVGGYCYFGGPLCVQSATFSTLVVHEMGHFFGLAHTFECAYGLETAQTCSVNGDLLCDTPPDRGPSGLKGIGSCDDGSLLNGSCTGTCGAKRCADGSIPDGYNWMSYYDCLPGRFSAGQQDFMRCMLDHEMIAYNADAQATTTTTSTTSTIADPPLCGDVNGDGRLSAGDALATLKAGVGLLPCPLWLCDYNGSGTLSASDALAVLQAAVGTGNPARCPPASS